MSYTRIEYDAWRRTWVAEEVTPATRTSPETAEPVATADSLSAIREKLQPEATR